MRPLLVGIRDNPSDVFTTITTSTNSLLQFCEVENAYSPLPSYTLTNVSLYNSNIARSARYSVLVHRLKAMFESEVRISRSREKAVYLTHSRTRKEKSKRVMSSKCSLYK